MSDRTAFPNSAPRRRPRLATSTKILIAVGFLFLVTAGLSTAAPPLRDPAIGEGVGAEGLAIVGALFLVGGVTLVLFVVAMVVRARENRRAVGATRPTTADGPESAALTSDQPTRVNGPDSTGAPPIPAYQPRRHWRPIVLTIIGAVLALGALPLLTQSEKFSSDPTRSVTDSSGLEAMVAGGFGCLLGIVAATFLISAAVSAGNEGVRRERLEAERRRQAGGQDH